MLKLQAPNLAGSKPSATLTRINWRWMNEWIDPWMMACLFLKLKYLLEYAINFRHLNIDDALLWSSINTQSHTKAYWNLFMNKNRQIHAVRSFSDDYSTVCSLKVKKKAQQKILCAGLLTIFWSSIDMISETLISFSEKKTTPTTIKAFLITLQNFFKRTENLIEFKKYINLSSSRDSKYSQIN